MLRRESGSTGELKQHGFLICVEAEDGVDMSAVALRLADGPRWMDGVGHVDVEYMGEIPEYEDPITVD